MIIESGLLEEFSRSSSTSLTRITGVPCHWESVPRGKLTLNTRFLLCSFLLAGLTSLSLIIYIFRQSWDSKINGVPLDVERISVLTMFLFGLCLILVFTYSLYMEPERTVGFVRKLAKLEESHDGDDDDQPWKKRVRQSPIVKVAVLTCKMVRLMNGALTPVFAMIGVISPGWALNLAQYSPINVILLPGDLLGGRAPVLGWLLNRLMTFSWNLMLAAFATSCFMLIVGLILTGSTGLITANLYFLRMVERVDSNWTGFYKQIQILTETFNALISSTLVFLLLDVTFGEVMAAFHLLGRPDIYTDSRFMFYALVLVDCVIGINFIFGYCGEVHHISRKGIGMRLRQNGMDMNTSFERKLYRRLVRSLPTVKVKFGSVNYIGRMTPAVFQQFATEKLVETLLLTKS